MRSSWPNIVDHYVIFSGDGDFRTLVEALQRRGRKVSIVSTMASQPPMISDDLRRQADNFIDLMSLKDELGREPVERPVRRPEPADRRRRHLIIGMAIAPAEPSRDCPLCPRLQDFIAITGAQREPAWFNAPVPTFLPPEGADSVRLLIVGLAPGLRGANRTGRPFTGDYAGDLLYSTLIRFGLARGQFLARPDDGLELAGRLSPTRSAACRRRTSRRRRRSTRAGNSWYRRSPRFPNLRAVLALGAIAHQSTVKALGQRLAAMPFKHGGRHQAGTLALFSSYHCSRYNTNTGVLTEEMFVNVFSEIANFLAK